VNDDYPEDDYPEDDYPEDDYPEDDYPEDDYPEDDYPEMEAPAKDWTTPLHLATNTREDGNENAEVLALLLAKGADPNKQDSCGITPLFTAAERGSLKSVALLLDHGADPNARHDYDWSTPLHWAAEGAYGIGRDCGNNNAEIVALLLDLGADFEAMNKRRETPLDVAVRKKNPETALILRSHIEARSLATTLDTVRPPETLPEPPARPRLFAGPNEPPVKRESILPPRGELGAPDPQPIKPRRMRL
jgi:ankyrin repeat protein